MPASKPFLTKDVVIEFAAVVILCWLIGLTAMVVLDRKIHRQMQYAVAGTSYKRLVANCGEPIHSSNAAKWKENHGNDSVFAVEASHIPANCSSVHEFSFFGAAYCYVLVDAEGVIIRSFWFHT